MKTQPPRQHEILSDEEREFARVVRALPGGDPPAALDALILKSATDAVASRPEKKSAWAKGLLGTSALWLGTAAASVLTIGIGWQVFQSMRAPIYELPDDENISSAQEIDSSHKSESLIVEIVPAREPLPTTPPPLLESNQATDAAASADDIASSEKPKTIAPEKRVRTTAARQEMTDTAIAKKSNDDKYSMRRDQAAEADWVPQQQAAGAVAPAPPPMPVAAAAPAAPAASADYREGKELQAVTVTGSRTRRVDEETSQPVQVLSRGYSTGTMNASIAEDAKLSPVLWLDAVKDRVKRGDIEGAKASLKLYKQTHPKLRIPEELKFLLR